MSHLFRLGVAAAAVTSGCFAQNVISAKAGLVHHTEGAVYVGDKEISVGRGEYPEMKAGEVLRTADGRAEILLTPGVFLRVSENSSVKLNDTRVENVRMELLSGTVLIEAGEVGKYDSIQIKVGACDIDFPKRGLFRIDADPARLRVYDGEALVIAGAEPLKVKEGRAAMLNGVVTAEKFDKNAGDAFHRWAGRRAGYMAAANVSVAKSILDGNRGGWNTSGWQYNPYFGMFTFIPANGIYFSPFGYAYYSPRRVERVFYRPDPIQSAAQQGWSGPDMSGRSSMGSLGNGGRSAVYSTRDTYSGPPAGASSAPAPAAPARGADSGSSRGGSSGR